MAVTKFSLKIDAELIAGENAEATHIKVEVNYNGVVNFAGTDGTYAPGGWQALTGGVNTVELPHTNIVEADRQSFSYWC